MQRVTWNSHNLEREIVLVGLYMKMTVSNVGSQGLENSFTTSLYVFVTNQEGEYFRADGILGIGPCYSSTLDYSFGYQLAKYIEQKKDPNVP